MAEQLKPDFCVIGGGPGGIAFASAAARLGRSVVLVEKARLGGTNLSSGGTPTKAFLAAAARAQQMRDAGGFGIRPIEPQVDLRAVTDHVFATIAAIAPNMTAERLGAIGVEVIAGEARFIDRATIVAGSAEIRAKIFVLATGSVPLVPPLPGLDRVLALTPDTIFTRPETIDRLIVLGGSDHGLEMAQGFRRLGAEVTVIEALVPLVEQEAEMRSAVLNRLAVEGVRIVDNARVERLEAYGAGVRVVFDRGGRAYSVDGSHVLLAVGRRPATSGLNLEAAGITYSAAGVAVSRALRTTNPRVYAIGDVTGAPPYAHVAQHQAGVLARRLLLRLPVRFDEQAVPRAIFTEPALAHVGLTEAAAKARYRAIRVLRWPYAENDRAQGRRETEGFVKIVTTQRGRIVGASIVGAEAGELIQVWALAMQKRLGIRAMASFVAPSPAMAEINSSVAQMHYYPLLASPLVQRVVSWLTRA